MGTKSNIIGQFSLDSLALLQISIAKNVGSSLVTIAFKSATFFQNKATINSYAPIEFPGSADN